MWMRIPIYHVAKVPSPFIKRRFWISFSKWEEKKSAKIFLSPYHPFLPTLYLDFKPYDDDNDVHAAYANLVSTEIEGNGKRRERG